MDSKTGLGLAGIGLAVFLFLIGYRQTVGARKERVRASNVDVQKILLRRVVLERYAPNVADIARIIEGKAREFRVRPDDLLSEEQILNGLYTSVVESDLIPPEQRREAIDRISQAFAEAE